MRKAGGDGPAGASGTRGSVRLELTAHRGTVESHPDELELIAVRQKTHLREQGTSQQDDLEALHHKVRG